MFHIVLYQPEIPSNTGNISRTCAVTGSVLHLIKPLGFSIEDKQLKRAGLDYWDLLDVRVYESLEDFMDKNQGETLWLIETNGEKYYDEVSLKDGSFLMFGRETKGLPKDFLEKFKERVIRIPMLDNPHARSLNLSNTVALVLYEALRQNGFLNLK